MKKALFFILIAFCVLLGCSKNDITEKLVFSASDIKKCECSNPNVGGTCYYDTVKTFLFTLSNVQGTLRGFPDDNINKTINIIIDNAPDYIKGRTEFGQPYYWWYIMSGTLSTCNMPNEIFSTKKYSGRKVIFSANVLIVPPPAKGQTYGQSDGYPIILKDIKIL
jgi:hypothetical protein